MILLFAAPVAAIPVAFNYQYQEIALSASQKEEVTASTTVPIVPFYSQFKDITSPKWQKVGCGVTSLAMIIDYYESAVPVNTLLKQGVAAGAYSNAGWTYSGLISLAQRYGLDGSSYDLGGSDSKTALERITKSLDDGPVIASVHYKFDPKSTIPHLVVINGIKDGVVFYNDPAAKTGEKQISVADFQKGWKKRFIVVRPTKQTRLATIAKI